MPGVTDSSDCVDVTSSVEVYDNGKTMECGCGHGVGVQVDCFVVKCHSCKKIMVDKNTNRDGEVDVEGGNDNGVDSVSGQSTLGDF